jgi:hypothetical protein
MEESRLLLSERLAAEIELLEAMYPDQIEWQLRSRELRFTSDHKDLLELRIPDRYPENELPTVIGARSSKKQDLRQSMQNALNQMTLSEGEEILDTIVQRYQDLTASAEDRLQEAENPQTANSQDKAKDTFKVVIVWLHHLLATGKRKLALSPRIDSVSSSAKISGVTKPGYPGIMLFSGATTLVDAHVAELKSQRWQAFHIRLEESCTADSLWKFQHGDGIKEVESMSEVVQDILDKDKQEVFLRAIGVK